MARIATGDYSTGDFRQFEHVYNKWGFVTGADTGRVAEGFYGHSAQVATQDPDCGYHGRFEVRAGDTATLDTPGTRERSETALEPDTGIGQTRWIAFSIKFDATFPTNNTSYGWGIVFQVHDAPNAVSSPVIAFGWPLQGAPGGYRDGYWYLTQNPQTAKVGGGWNFTSETGYAKPLAELPLNVGQWQDIKMEIKYAQDTSGLIRLWHNGVRQTFTSYGGGGQTFTGQTLLPSGSQPGQEVTGAWLAHGLYRQSGSQLVPPVSNPTGIVYHANLRVADSEASL